MLVVERIAGTLVVVANQLLNRGGGPVPSRPCRPEGLL